MATQREKQLAIAILKERVEHMSGKKVVLKEATGIQDTLLRIEGDLTNFLNSIVIPRSKGYVKNERDAALLLYDILKNKYIMGMK